MKKVVVTGGTGFVGKHLTRLLSSREDVYLILIDNLSNSNLPDFLNKLKIENDNWLIEGTRLRFYRADICNASIVEKIFSDNENIDICIHLAAKISVAESMNSPQETYDVNVKGTQNLLAISSKYGARNFVFASSAAVYGNSKCLPLSENENARPISPYGDSKLKAENLVSGFTARRVNTVVLRFFNIYGRGQTAEYAGVITKFANRLQSGLPPLIHGSGSQRRDFISIRDVIRAIIIASGLDTDHDNDLVENNNENVYNICTGIPTTINDLAKIMIRLFGSEIQPNHIEATPGDIVESYGDPTKSSKILGFKFRDDISSGLRNLLT